MSRFSRRFTSTLCLPIALTCGCQSGQLFHATSLDSQAQPEISKIEAVTSAADTIIGPGSVVLTAGAEQVSRHHASTLGRPLSVNIPRDVLSQGPAITGPVKANDLVPFKNSPAELAASSDAQQLGIGLVTTEVVDAAPKRMPTPFTLIDFTIPDDQSGEEETIELGLPEPEELPAVKPNRIGSGAKNDSLDMDEKSELERDLEKEEKSSEDSAPEPSVESLPAPQPSTEMANESEYSEPLGLHEAVRITLSQNKGIMVLGYVPQEAGTFISTEQAAFDPIFRAGVLGGKFDRQYANFINTGGVIPTNEQKTDFAGVPENDRNVMSITKLLETGGIIEAGVSADYLYQDPAGPFILLNPAWRSAINLRLTQPLGRGRGREVTLAPLRIAQAGRNQANHEFQSLVNETLRDVQVAYWLWKLAERQYAVRRDAVKQARQTVKLEREKIDLDEGSLPDLQQAEDQLQRFRIDAALAKNELAKARITVSQIMGVPADQLRFARASDEPAAFSSGYLRETGQATALSRPELMAMQSQIRAAEIEARLAANNMKPDLNARFDYSVSGLEENLDDSIETAFDNRFNDWAVQLEYRRAKGLRAECAQLRRARLQLVRLQAERDQVQHLIQAEVARVWEDLQTQLEARVIQRERVEIARAQVEGRTELYSEGEGSLDLKVRAQSSLIDALLALEASEVAVQQQIVEWEYVTNQQRFVEYASE